MHWNDQFAAKARVDVLVPAVTDPISGQPASKHVAARIERFESRATVSPSSATAPAKARRRLLGDCPCERRLAGRTGLHRWRAGLECARGHAIWREGRRRRALLRRPGGRPTSFRQLHGGSSDRRPVPRARAGRRLAQLGCRSARRQFLRATSTFCGRRGPPRQGTVDRGATVCSCFGVGAKQIAAAVAAGCVTVDAIGRALQAGTNCGSCRSEIQEIIDAHRLQAAE